MAATHTSIHISIHRSIKSADTFDVRDKTLSKNGRENEFMHRLHYDRIQKKRLRDLMIEISMAKSNFILQKVQKKPNNLAMHTHVPKNVINESVSLHGNCISFLKMVKFSISQFVFQK